MFIHARTRSMLLWERHGTSSQGPHGTPGTPRDHMEPLGWHTEGAHLEGVGLRKVTLLGFRFQVPPAWCRRPEKYDGKELGLEPSALQ